MVIPLDLDAACQVRRYRPDDRQAVRSICAATAWLGEPDPDRVPDGWLWAEFWTRYFTDREPRHTWVVEHFQTGRIVGYLSGTADVRRVDRYIPFLLPGVVLHVARAGLMRRPRSRRAILNMLQSLIRGELELPSNVRRDFPAAFHFNLLPEARGQRLGTRLFEAFLDSMRRMGVRGIHAQAMSVNRVVAHFLSRQGFRRIGTSSLHAFRHIDPQPIELHTWVLPL